MTIIASPHIESVRGLQLTSALALSHALTHDLPVCYWVVFSTTSGIQGQIPSDSGTAAERIAAVETWARFLGGPTVQHHRYETYVAVQMRSVVYRDARVDLIYTHISLSEYDALMGLTESAATR